MARNKRRGRNKERRARRKAWRLEAFDLTEALLTTLHKCDNRILSNSMQLDRDLDELITTLDNAIQPRTLCVPKKGPGGCK